jgi:hypothetical protein
MQVTIVKDGQVIYLNHPNPPELKDTIPVQVKHEEATHYNFHRIVAEEAFDGSFKRSDTHPLNRLDRLDRVRAGLGRRASRRLHLGVL